MTDSLAALQAEFGAPQVRSGAAALPFERDWRGQFTGHALAVLLPRSRDELQAMLRWCHARRLPLVPQGGNTGLVGGSTPDASGTELVLSLQRLNRVRRVSTLDLTIEAEAGCLLAQLQAAAAEQGCLFPLSMASEGSCQLGGNLATNGGGTQVLRWGNARDLCLGLEVVLADGRLISDLSGLRKDHRGLNLRDLFIGSEGLLGVITAAVMKLVPAPRTRLVAWLGCASLAQAVALLHSARQALGDWLSGFEVMNEAVQALLTDARPAPPAAAPWAVLLELSSGLDDAPTRAALLDWLPVQGALAGPAVLSQSQAQYEQLWALRESVPERQTRAGGNLKHDISLPLSTVAAFVDAVQPALQRLLPGVRPQVFGHLGDGNLHFNLAAPVGMTLQALREQHGQALTRCVFEHVAQHGGSFSAEHGIGRLRRAELAACLSPAQAQLMHALKQTLDPAGLLNPGRVL